MIDSGRGQERAATHSCVLGLCVLLAVATSVAAQTPNAVPADGARIRVSSSFEALRGHVARLDSVRRDSVFLAGRTFAMSRVDRLEVSLGRRSYGTKRGAKRGAKIGALVGSAFGLVLIGVAVSEDAGGSDAIVPATPIAIVMAPAFSLLGIAGGAVVGAAVGSRTTDNWALIR